MVVEDESIVALDIEHSLRSLGYAVPALAASGEEAIEKAGEIRPDLVLMDITLKGNVDGVEAAEHIRLHYDIPVVYLTAHADDTTLARAKITEPFGYILKPFEDRQLHITIEMAFYKHKMERKLRENEQWLAAILRSIDDAVIATDTGGFISFMNPQAEALTGWRQSEVMGKDVAEVLHLQNEEGRDLSLSPSARAIREGTVVGIADQALLVSRDGSQTPIDCSAAPIRDEKANVTGSVLIMRDITERKHAEEVLRQAAQRFRSLVEATSDMIFTLAADGTTTSLNPAFEAITGWPREQWMNKPFAPIIHPEDQASHAEMVQRALRGETPPWCEVRMLSKSGGYVVMELTATPQTRHGQVIGVWGVGRDITQRKRMEEAMRP